MPTKNEKKKNYLREYQKNWVKKRRQDWIDENGPCKKCGSFESLEVDHIIPSLKTMAASSIWSRTLEVRLKELANCQVLCKKCHLIKTLSERPKPTHGTLTMYDDYKCRCEDCREAKRKKEMKRRNPSKYKEVYGDE